MKRFYILIALLLAFSTQAFSQSFTISGGFNFAAMICSDGGVITWGGDITVAKKPPTISPTPANLPTGVTFKSLTAGSGSHIVAVSCNNIAYAWGNNAELQCGKTNPKGATTVTIANPIPKGETPGYDLDGNPDGDYLGNVKMVAASTSGSFALLNDGKVVGWGGNGGSGGKWVAANTPNPFYITYSNGNPVENVIHIAGGDNNILITVDADGDGLGELYSLGSWNGRGGGASATEYVAAPVLKGDETANPPYSEAIAPPEPLTNIRTSGLADVGGWGVDVDGYVWGWGNQGFNNVVGTGVSVSHGYAGKVISGEYKEISGEDYLTDVKEVVGGNSYGMAITKEGYVVGWGGDIFDNGKDKTPVFLNYCDGTRVTDAVHIARGDHFGFMVNSNNEYFAIGKNENKEFGIASPTASQCFTKINVDNSICTPPDLPIEASMSPLRTKCPEEILALHSGFISPTEEDKADDYYFTWYRNNVKLNTSTKESLVADRQADPWNKTNPQIIDEGEYRVVVEYIGSTFNGPCTSTDPPEPATAQTTVVFKEMPITETTACFDNSTTPENVNFTFTSKYEDARNFSIYSEATGGTALETISVAGGGNGTFTVAASALQEVLGEDGKVLYYDAYVEDAAAESGALLEDCPPKSSSTMNKDYKPHLLVTAYEAILLESLDINVVSGTGTVTAVIYDSKKNPSNILTVDTDNPIHTGEMETINGAGKYRIPINYEYYGSTRGISYFIGIKVTGSLTIVNEYDCDFSQTNNSNIEIKAIYTDVEATGYTTTTTPRLISNIKFQKLSSYDCGRMKMRAPACCEHTLEHDATSGAQIQTDEIEDNPIKEIRFEFGGGATNVNFDPPLPAGMSYSVINDCTIAINGVHPVTTGDPTCYTLTTTGDACSTKSAEIRFAVTPLPVELTQFEAQAVAPNVLVRWETKSETNNDYFTLWRSRDGVSFEQIAHIAGVGNSSIPRHYSFVDKNPISGIAYYRLQQTDFDGTTTVHHVIPVNLAPEQRIFTVVNSFNNGVTTLQCNFSAAEYSNVIRVYSVKGELIYEQNIDAGIKQQDITLNLKSGIYIVRNFYNNKISSLTIKVAY